MTKKSARPPLAPALLLFILVIPFLILRSLDWLGRAKSPQPTPFSSPSSARDLINLPSPQKSKGMSVEQALQNRRNRRSFLKKALNLSQVSQILWAAQGVTTAWGDRTAPSVKSVYPLEVYLLDKNVDQLSPGVYHYLPASHQLERWLSTDVSSSFIKAANDQPTLEQAPLVIIITGKNISPLVYQESGHAAQNIYLEAESLRLGTIALTNFDSDAVKSALQLPETETVVYLLPLGLPTEE